MQDFKQRSPNIWPINNKKTIRDKEQWDIFDLSMIYFHSTHFYNFAELKYFYSDLEMNHNLKFSDSSRLVGTLFKGKK